MAIARGNVKLIEIQTPMYMELNQNRNLSGSEKKVKFLFNHVPAFRKMKRNIVEELE